MIKELPAAKDFFAYARKREGLRRRREIDLLPKPWTDDVILQNYRFCNVFREDDRVTRWFRENIREPLRHQPEVVFATICFRIFNRVRTGEILLRENLHMEWDPDKAHEALEFVHPVVTGAYIVKTPTGLDKLSGVIEILDPIWKDRYQLARDLQALGSLEEGWRRLCFYPWVGAFTAYEFITDLRHTDVCDEASDIMTWANPGPGAGRGLMRILGRPLTNGGKPIKDVQPMMRELLEMSKNPDNWPRYWPAWEMREVEHTLCEFDKYERARLNQGVPKQRYYGIAQVMQKRSEYDGV